MENIKMLNDFHDFFGRGRGNRGNKGLSSYGKLIGIPEVIISLLTCLQQ